MKKFIFAIVIMCYALSTNAQNSFIETFDSNSLEWTECAYETNSGTALIDQGVMTIKSKGKHKTMGAIITGLSGVATIVGENTFFETHCYAPIDVAKPFKIISHVKIDKLGSDRIVGLVFNYKDDGNFYCFTFDEGMVRFTRYKDGRIVGSVSQGVRWADKSKVDQEWVLTSEDGILSFIVDGVPILKVKYMTLEYSGFGYYTFGKQKLIVDDVEFIEL